jgi:hypothetical protein
MTPEASIAPVDLTAPVAAAGIAVGRLGPRVVPGRQVSRRATAFRRRRGDRRPRFLDDRQA